MNMFVRQLFGPNFGVLWEGSEPPKLGFTPSPENPKKWGSPPSQRTPIWSKQLSCKQLPTLWVSTFYVDQFKNFTLKGPFWGGEGLLLPEEPQIW